MTYVGVNCEKQKLYVYEWMYVHNVYAIQNNGERGSSRDSLLFCSSLWLWLWPGRFGINKIMEKEHNIKTIHGL